MSGGFDYEQFLDFIDAVKARHNVGLVVLPASIYDQAAQQTHDVLHLAGIGFSADDLINDDGMNLNDLAIRPSKFLPMQYAALFTDQGCGWIPIGIMRIADGEIIDKAAP